MFWFSQTLIIILELDQIILNSHNIVIQNNTRKPIKFNIFKYKILSSSILSILKYNKYRLIKLTYKSSPINEIKVA